MNSKLNVILYNEDYQNIWDDFVSKAKNSTFLFYRDFMEYHSDRFLDFSLMVYKEDKLVAVLPANIVQDTIHSHQGLSYGGLLLQPRVIFEDVVYILKSILLFLESKAISTLSFKLTPEIYHNYPSNEIDYLLFLLKASLIRRDISATINMSNKKLPMSTNRRRNLKKALNSDILVKEVDDLSDFWGHILIPNLGKKHQALPVHTIQEISYLKSKFPENIKQFNAYHNNSIIAGVTLFLTDQVVHAQYISTRDEFKKLGGLDAIFNYLIGFYSHKRYFDFGISNENHGRCVNLGLLSWKESFGARVTTHDFYNVKTKNHSLLDAFFV